MLTLTTDIILKVAGILTVKGGTGAIIEYQFVFSIPKNNIWEANFLAAVLVLTPSPPLVWPL